MDVIFRERSLITAASSSTDPACSAAPGQCRGPLRKPVPEPQETCSAEMFICLKVSFRKSDDLLQSFPDKPEITYIVPSTASQVSRRNLCQYV